MFGFLKRKKQELPTAYKRLLEKLHEKYPGKYIDISTGHKYFNHTGGYYKIEYSVYVEHREDHKYFPTFSEVEKYVQYLCKKEG